MHHEENPKGASAPVPDSPGLQRGFLAVYNVDRNYGGPEEGGWWYDSGRLVSRVAAVRYVDADGYPETVAESEHPDDAGIPAWRLDAASARWLAATVAAFREDFGPHAFAIGRVSSVAYDGFAYSVQWRNAEPEEYYPAEGARYE